MNRIFAIIAVCGFAAVALALNIPTPPAGVEHNPKATLDQPHAAQLIVHEWGTFTGFVGSDGVHLPFGTQIGGDLPPFVTTRLAQAKRHDPKLLHWFDWGKGGGAIALQRMETPVIYFYTDQPRDVTVRVDFPQGLLTEFYPPVRQMLPAFGDAPREPRFNPDGILPTTRRAPQLANSALDWGTIRIIPRTAGQPPTNMPEVAPEAITAAHYQYARETDAATVQFSDRPGEVHEERFLFYRGLGDFTLPVTLRALDNDRFEMTSTASQPIRFALLLHIDGPRARFAAYRDITAATAMTLPQQSVAIDEVGNAIASALVAEGLYEKEARAMVKTWSSNWLGEAGTRILYIVPRGITDDLLPLQISPSADETVRILVGRIDILTPQQEAHLQSLLATSQQIESLEPEDAIALANLGRFLEPALQRAAAQRASKDPKAEINKLRKLHFRAMQVARAAAQSADSSAAR